VRQCPTCQCFVPEAAHHCPRCAAELSRIEVPIEVRADAGTERDGADERDLVLVGAGSVAPPLTGSRHPTHSDPIASTVAARLALPPVDGPAGRPRRPQLPKLPQPFAPDPLSLAVYLGIPRREPLAPDTFSALMGAPTTKPPAERRRDHAQPLVRATMPARPPAPPTTATATTPLFAVPVAATSPGTSTLQPLRRQFARRDPFAPRATRRERLLTRLCMLLAIALALSVVVLRLPLGQRPELGASSIGIAPPAVATPFDYGIRLQSRADLRAALSVIERVYPVWKTYATATPAVLHRSLPQFAFVAGSRLSQRVGVISVAAAPRRIVLAEYAGTDECVFERVIDRHPAESAMGPRGTPCRASAIPTHGWKPLNTS
jgi:hypothetical protein